MPKLLLWGIFLLNVVTVVLTLFITPTFYARRRDRIILAWRQAGLWAFIVLLFLTIFSYFFGWLEYLWEKLVETAWTKWEKVGRWFPTGLHGKYHRVIQPIVIEIWILSLAALNVVILFSIIEYKPLIVIIPILTLADILYTLDSLLVFSGRPRSMARSLLLLIVRYFEVVNIFGSLYIFAQYLTDSPIFSVHGAPSHITPYQAFYFSVVTGATVGFGDISPQVNAFHQLPFIIRPSTLVIEEVFCLFIIIAIEIPRLFTRSSEANQIHLDISKQKEPIIVGSIRQNETTTILSNRLINMQDEVNQLTQHILATFKEQNQNLIEDNCRFQTKLAEAEKGSAALSQELIQLDNKLSRLREQNVQLKAETEILKQENQALTNRNTDLQTELARALTDSSHHQ